MRQNAMKNLVSIHHKFRTGINLKPLRELSTNEFVKLMRLCFGNETGDLSGAQQQILRALYGKPLAYVHQLRAVGGCLPADSPDLRDLCSQLPDAAQHRDASNQAAPY